MFGKILKFIGIAFLIYILPIVPFGSFMASAIIGYALWKMVNT